MNNRSAIELVLFRGFAGTGGLCVAGRVMHRSQLVPARSGTRWHDRLREAWRLLVSRRVPAAQIELRHADRAWHARSDRHGYFLSCSRGFSAPQDGHWSPYQARVVGVPDAAREQGPAAASGVILHAPPRSEQIVISDIDDTIVHTGVANKALMLWRMYMKPGSQRAPFPGMGDFLRGLHAGASGLAHNPMIYISRSPWSLYPALEDLFNKHGIPTGPVLLLRDWGITLRHPFPRRAADHKASMIDRVLDCAPDIPVILVGDSGQRDPETYAAAVRRHPGRVRGIYIRDLSLSASRSRSLHELGARLEALGVRFVAARNAEEMARHALAQGWLRADSKQPAQGTPRVDPT